MKTILVGINAKFTHSNLAIRSLRQCAPGHEVNLCEVTINDRIDPILARLVGCEGDAYGFSCYIWNMELVLKAAELIKKTRPGAVVFLGGPEVSFDAAELLDAHPFVDYIFTGEGEEAFPAFLDFLESEGKGSAALEAAPAALPAGVAGRGHGSALTVVKDLDSLPFAYTPKDMEALRGRILYYETMRGCPYHCAYCLSSAMGAVRMVSLERVFKDLTFFMEAGVRQVKFVDRTFNVDRKRCVQILDFLAQADTTTNFHFEIAGDLVDEAMLAIVEASPKGRFQFEVGIQSTNEATLSAITRKTDTAVVFKRVRRLVACRKAHIHVDLIAGLPCEDLASFARSFDDVYALKADMLQLGFLKLLKGTAIRREAERHHYVYRSFPPYEVIANDVMSPEDLLLLKRIEPLVEGLNNSGRFRRTLDCLTAACPSPCGFFKDLSDFALEEGFYDAPPSREDWYRLVYAYSRKNMTHLNHSNTQKRVMLPSENEDWVAECLVWDYLCLGARTLPDFLPDHQPEREGQYRVLKDDGFMAAHFPDLAALPARKRKRALSFQVFNALARQSGLPAGSAAVFHGGRGVWVDPADFEPEG